MINIKILHIKTQMRYAVRRVVDSAVRSLLSEYPDLQVDITEISDMDEITKYTTIMVAPGLVINEKLVYATWIPRKEQVIGWLR